MQLGSDNQVGTSRQILEMIETASFVTTDEHIDQFCRFIDEHTRSSTGGEHG